MRIQSMFGLTFAARRCCTKWIGLSMIAQLHLRHFDFLHAFVRCPKHFAAQLLVSRVT